MQVADLYEKLEEMENRAIALSQLTMLLAELKDMEQCSKCLTSLLEVCHELDNPKLKGKVDLIYYPFTNHSKMLFSCH